MDSPDFFERRFPWFEQDYRREYGVHRFDLKNGIRLAALSAHGWKNFLAQLQAVKPDDDLAVSPELITTTELETNDVSTVRPTVEKRFEEIRAITLQFPNTTFLLGTPVFEGEGKPTNSIVYIKAGQIIGQTAKRSGIAAWEKTNFRFEPEEPASLIPGTDIGVLICSDLPLADLYQSPPIQDLNRVLELHNRRDLVGKNPTFIHPDTRNLVVASCWGIGGRYNILEEDPDEYYKRELRNTSFGLLRVAPKISQIAVVDRAPDIDPALDKTIATRPINALFGRKN